MQQLSKHIFDYLYVGYGIKRKLLISSMRIIVLFALCRYAHSCAFISVIELPRIPAYCPKFFDDFQIYFFFFSSNYRFKIRNNFYFIRFSLYKETSMLKQRTFRKSAIRVCINSLYFHSLFFPFYYSEYSFYLHTSTQPVAPAIFSSSSTVSFTALWSSPAAG